MLELDLERAEKLIAGFIRHIVDQAGFSGVVLGLSGGLDSAVVAALASRCLGPDKVLGLMLPHRISSSESLEHAKLVAQKFGIRTKIIEITDMASGYHEETDKLRFGNLLARLRMCVIFDQSQATKSLVLGTSNKTEMLVGYTTWWGDMAAGCYPIADLYKTQVRALAKHLGVPDVIISKPPTADLWSGQTDEGEMGITYEHLDNLLVLMVEGEKNDEQIVQKGFLPEEIQRVRKMVARAHFKRVMPPVCKISSRTIGIDFNYIKDWSTSGLDKV
jgi:NAD+ synthase